MTAQSRLSRLVLVLPTVLTAVLGCAAVVVTASSSPTAPATRAVSYANGNPMGYVDLIRRVPGGLHVRGWTFDPNSRRSAIVAYALIDGKGVGSHMIADLSRTDVARAYPSAGATHGFDWRIPVPQGRHTVCVKGSNVGRGQNQTLRCRTATFDYGPAGSFQQLTMRPGAVHISGWALDGDSWTAPLAVRVTVDGTLHTLTANIPRTDVAALNSGTGSDHGFAATYPVAQGRHTVCVTAVNIGFGQNTNFGCASVLVSDRPFGSLDVPRQRSGTLRVQGWAIDPDAPTSPLAITITADSALPITVTANRSRPDVAANHPGSGAAHGYYVSLALSEGTHQICATALNIGLGSNRFLGCRTAVVNFTPSASLTSLTSTRTGLSVSGWAQDPDTSNPISTHILLDGRTVSAVTANRTGATHNGHNFSASVTTRSGRHTVCVIGINTLWGTHNSTQSCRTITLALSPLGHYDTATRLTGSTSLSVTGWAFDPDTTSPLTVTTTLDGAAGPSLTANSVRTDVGQTYPGFGSNHGIVATLAADAGEHRVCLTAQNVGGGTNTSLGCRIVNAVHPVVPTVVRGVIAVGGFGGATVNWQAPTSDGGAPWSGYTITSAPGNVVVTVPAGSTSAVVTGLKAKRSYAFIVRAVNVAGSSPNAWSAWVRTSAGPPAQRTPAPISTSRYIRNVRGSSAAELAMMRSEGATDARHNPSGHGYLVLLDIGGQDAYDNGVVLSATTRFVSYYDLVRDVQAYLSGYHSAQQASAPVVVAIGTNNDMDVSTSTGRVWATQVVNPIAAYARRYLGMSIAGANDIEPGFRASYTSTRHWLAGYLSATNSPFVFNGSADGCAWTTTSRACNNGWTMYGLHYLAGAAAPTRILNLPQVYNTTMAAQWKYISLTGVVHGLPRINFAGVLTEYTACAQSGGCGSLGGHTAWSRMWSDLQSDPRLKVSSLPYSTDLRVDP